MCGPVETQKAIVSGTEDFLLQYGITENIYTYLVNVASMCLLAALVLLLFFNKGSDLKQVNKYLKLKDEAKTKMTEEINEKLQRYKFEFTRKEKQKLIKIE